MGPEYRGLRLVCQIRGCHKILYDGGQKAIVDSELYETESINGAQRLDAGKYIKKP